MGQPWGLTGPEFLGIYAASTVVVVQLSSAWCRLVTLATSRRVPRELNPAEVGYLAGGPQRAAQVIIAGLVECGAWRVSSAGLVTESDGAVADTPPWLGVGPISAGGSTARIQRHLKASPAVASIRLGLRADGLVPSRSQLAVMWEGSAMFYLALLTGGLLRVQEGVANHRPVSFLVYMIVLSAILIPLWLRRKAASASRPTRSGRRYVRELRRAQAIRPISQVSPVGLALAGAPDGAPAPAIGWGTATPGAVIETGLLGVALAGFAGVPDEMTRSALIAGLPSQSSGSGCGGSGCGGGGCGGGCGG